MRVFLIVALNAQQARFHIPEILERFKLNPINKFHALHYEGNGWTLRYVDDPSRIRGFRNIELIKVGEWYKNPRIDEIENTVKGCNL